MNRTKTAFIAMGLALVCAIPLLAQQARPRTSPHETVSGVIDGNRVTITYGRPYSKDPRGAAIRKIWGALVPWDKAWRMGSDEATTLIAQQPIVIGETTIPAGASTIYLIPSESGTTKMVFSKQLGQWGIKQDGSVDESGEFAKVDAKKEALPQQLDQFTMSVDRNPSGGGLIKLMWENTQFSVAFTVKK